jgi:hypothetical protein
VRCPNECSAHGLCTAINGTGVCACEAAWSGEPDCSSYLAPLLTNGSLATVSVGADEWRYFALFVSLDINHVMFMANLTSATNATQLALVRARACVCVHAHAACEHNRSTCDRICCRPN